MKKLKVCGIVTVVLLLCAAGVIAGSCLYNREEPEANEDIYAWLEIPGTEINAPVVQTKAGDSFYTAHDVQKEENPQGALFTEDYNSRTFDDAITVIYGNNNSVFGDLFQYLDNLYMKEHSQIYISANGQTSIYRVFAAYKTDNRHILERFDFGKSEGNRKAYLDSILNNRAMDVQIDSSVQVDPDSKILTLSTHDTGDEQERFLVQAYLEKCEEGERSGNDIEE